MSSSSGSGGIGYFTPGTSFGGRASLARIGGSLGVAGNCVGWLVFLAMCAGFHKAVFLGPIALLLGVIGMVLTIVGAVTQKDHDVDTHVLASLFINLFAIVGGLFQTAILMKWTFIDSAFPH